MTRNIPQPAFDAPANDWLVYGDALQEDGDPRGELIALGHAAQQSGDTAARDAYVRANWAKLVGDISPMGVTIDWHYGIARKLTIDEDATSNRTGGLLSLPIAKDLREIELRGVGTVDLSRAMEAIAQRAPASCTRFAFVDHRATQSEMLISRDFEPPNNLVTFGSLAPFWAKAESISIDCADADQLVLGEPINAPRLKSFALRALRLCDWEDLGTTAYALNQAQWPLLESFELRLTETWCANIPNERSPYVPVYSAGGEDGEDERYDEADDGDSEGIDYSQLAPLWKTLAACPLQKLSLTSFLSTLTLIPALAEAGLAPTVKELDFSDSELQDSDIEMLLEHRALFAKLERLVLERTLIHDLARLEALGPTIIHSTGIGAKYRYVVGQE